MLTLLPRFSSRLSVRFLGKADDLTLPSNCAWLHQIHGKRTIRVYGPMDATEQADGMITDVIGLPLVIRIADCQNLCVVAPEKRVMGALHAGWRGLVAGAIEEFFAVLKKEWKIDPKDTWIAAGPSLCQACAEFTDPLKELPGIDPKFFDGRCVDLRGIADAKFAALGVPKDRIERHPDCTRCNPETYWSYRAERSDVARGKHNLMVCTLM